MERHKGFQSLLLGATALVLMVLVAPAAAATERQGDGWLHGTEAPTAPEVTDGWMTSGARYQATDVKPGSDVAADGWATSLETIRRIASAPDRPPLSLALRREAHEAATGTVNEGPAVTAAAATDGWMHSNLVESYRPPVAISGGAAGISLELAAGISTAALLIGFAFATFVISRRYRGVHPA